jgi:hypothetical protein
VTRYLLTAGPRRPLPRTRRPAQDETTGSYLLRLAAANQITSTDLAGYLTAGTAPRAGEVSLRALAAASGHSQLALAYALPQLRPQHPDHQAMALTGRTLPGKPNTVRPACRRCAAAHPPADRIDIWYRPEQTICRRHQLWTGTGADHPADQPDLSSHPEVVHAQTRHLRLIRKHSRQIAHPAYDTARLVWEAIAYRGRGLPPVTARNIPPPGGSRHQEWPARPSGPAQAAAAYPEIITLAGLFASPQWRPAAITASAGGPDRFRAELQHRLPAACRDLINTDILMQAITLGARAARWHEPSPGTSP